MHARIARTVHLRTAPSIKTFAQLQPSMSFHSSSTSAATSFSSAQHVALHQHEIDVYYFDKRSKHCSFPSPHGHLTLIPRTPRLKSRMAAACGHGRR